jgi:amidohydrolase
MTSVVDPSYRLFCDIRRDIHRHPELSFQEFRTSELVAQCLRQWGIEVHQGLAGTGVVGTIQGRLGASTRAIGLRADMDALPLQEHNTFDHASIHPGKMHACGHDGHTAMLLAAAHDLAQTRDFDGTVYVIFQPAEEGGGGAKRMMDEGLFERFPMQAVFAMHNWPGLPTGHMAVSAGPVMASSSEFKVRLQGKGAHAAMPHMGTDPVVAACQLVQAYQTIVTRNMRPIDAGVVSVTMIHAGDATNIIADDCIIEGTVRTFGTPVLDLIESRMHDLTQHMCAGFGIAAQFEFKRNYPPTINHAKEAAFALQVMQATLPANTMGPQEPTMGAEDFAFMLQACPGAYIFIGNGMGDHRLEHDAARVGAGPCTLHNPSYDFNDDLIAIGAPFWVALTKRWLASEG